MSGSVVVLKKPGGGGNTHSVFKVFFSVPMFVLRPNRENWSERREIPLLILVLDSKTNVP